MNSLTHTLMRDHQLKGMAFVPYIAMGYPSWEVSFDLVCSLFDLGASSIELGMPFTDPVADGVVLQDIFQKVLQSNLFSIEKMFFFLEKICKAYPKKEFILMGYLNIFYKNGWFENHFETLHKYHIFNIVIPDLPLEEEIYLKKKFALDNSKNKINFIHFITPSTPFKRFKYLLENSSGFIYLLSYKGVTGKENTSLQLSHYSKEMQNCCFEKGIPVLVGFGVSTKKHLQEILKFANGFIIGSFIYKIVQDHLNKPEEIAKHVSREITKIF